MMPDQTTAEAELRSRIYAALIEITNAEQEEKKAIANRLKATSGQLYDLIVYGTIPNL